jgi:RNA polymerase sigma-70 factor, ECF subfamily
MPASRERDVTQILRAWAKGDHSALERLTPVVYQELHKAARIYMSREATGHTLQPTALINEVYVRLVDLPEIDWQSRAHFFAVCARMMRRILTDHARSRRVLKRGGEAQRVTLDEVMLAGAGPSPDLLALDEAMNKLGDMDPRKSQVVELRFFGGLSVQETAEVLQVSSDTVTRDWNFARTWLLREMRREL